LGLNDLLPIDRSVHSALPFRKKKPFSLLFPGANPDAIDLMERCLTFNPKRRIEVEEALAHPYLQVCHSHIPSGPILNGYIIQPYHDPQDEPTAAPLPLSFFDFDNGEQLSKEQLKRN
jgi:mitogen-activated protein kinase 1/3